MPCSKCDEPAVIDIRYSGQSLCKAHFLRFFERRAKAEVKAQGKLPSGTIAVALSGGKDSVSLLAFLAELTRDRPDVQLAAITVDEGIAGYRDGAIEICREITEQLGVEWHLITTKEMSGYTIDEYGAGGGKDPTGEPRPACGPCGVFRRTGLNRVARDIGAVAVATGHNLDDTAQTILMNVLGGDIDRLARLAPHSIEKEGMVPRILPFRTIPEKEVLLYALLTGLPLHHDEECPYAARAQRWFLRDKLWELEERNPGTRHSLLAFQDRLKPLLAGADAPPMNTCACGEPTSGTTCKACGWAL